jgi:hypothetical protein
MGEFEILWRSTARKTEKRGLRFSVEYRAGPDGRLIEGDCEMQMTDLRENLISLMLRDWLKEKDLDDLARDLLVGSKQTVEELLRQILPP